MRAPWVPKALTCALTFVLSACSVSPASTKRCVFESGAISTGSCLTRCESLCGLESRAGCASTDCTADCEAATALLPDACADAMYEHWRCLRVQGLPSIECTAGMASVSEPTTVCVGERERETRVCGLREGGTD